MPARTYRRDVHGRPLRIVCHPANRRPTNWYDAEVYELDAPRPELALEVGRVKHATDGWIPVTPAGAELDQADHLVDAALDLYRHAHPAPAQTPPEETK